VPDSERYSAPLYRSLLGARFDVLPPRVRELHDLTEHGVWIGRADVERGQSWLARTLADLLSLPPEGKDQPLGVSFVPVDGREEWTRWFGTRTFGSVQFERAGMLAERIGVTCMLSALEASEEGLGLKLQGVRVLGIPLPSFLHPRVRTYETERDGLYHFEAEAHLPFAGLLVRYTGWLETTADVPSA
jgi:Domain of unknown function (DUF4166)